MGKRPREDDPSLTLSPETSVSAPESPAKLVELDPDDHDTVATTLVSQTVMQCSLPPHKPVTFASIDEFDIHYAKEHTHRCVSCGKNFPTAHFLSLHIDENHNPVREALASKGEKTYACFLEDCDRKCSTPQKRRLHLIDKHMFPKNYNFRIVDFGIDRADSMLRGGQRRRLSVNEIANQRRSSQSTSVTHTVQSGTADQGQVNGLNLQDSKISRITPPVHNKPGTISNAFDESVDELQSSFAALKFVPPSVQAKQRNAKHAKG